MSEKVMVALTNSKKTMYPKLFSHMPSRRRPQAHPSRLGLGHHRAWWVAGGGDRGTSLISSVLRPAMGDAKTELYRWDPDPGLNLDSSTHFLQALGESILFSEPPSPNLSLGSGGITEVKSLGGCYQFRVYISAPRFTC